MSPTELPVITDDVIDRLEAEVFRGIADERERVQRSRTRRRRTWIGVGAAAAIVAVAAVISPAVLGGLGGSAGSGVDQSAMEPGVGLMDAPVQGGDTLQGATIPGAGIAESAVDGDAARETAGEAGASTGRDIIATASASVRVDDVKVGADRVAAIAVDRGGYVESMSVGTDGSASIEGMDSSMIYPPQPEPGSGWITVRVPADDLQAAIDDLDALGEVSTVSITRSDVTDQTIDLRARVEATRASVERLTELMQQTGSVADLIAAEVALSDRQALLESYEQQLAQLEGQVAMSSLQVTLSTVTTPVKADPAGFGDGFVAGWNSLVAALNGVVVALGFLIPWLVVIAVVGLIVWGAILLVRRRRSAPQATAKSPAATDTASGERHDA